MACFRVDYCGRGELADRQQKLNQFLSRLTHMAEEFNVCVLMVSPASPADRDWLKALQTNQVQSDPGASALFAGADGRKPVGGHILAHASTTRVLLRKGRGDERVAKIQDSPGRPFFCRCTLDLLMRYLRLPRARGYVCYYQRWYQ